MGPFRNVRGTVGDPFYVVGYPQEIRAAHNVLGRCLHQLEQIVADLAVYLVDAVVVGYQSLGDLDNPVGVPFQETLQGSA